jgi:hypothetical protein
LLLVAEFRRAGHHWKTINESKVAENSNLLQSNLTGDPFTNLLECFESRFKQRLESCFGREFCAITEPLFTEEEIDAMIQECEDLVPGQLELMMGILGFDAKMRISRNEHLISNYRRRAFYLLLSTARVRNPQNFVYWGMVQAAANMARGQKRNQGTRGSTALCNRLGGISRETPAHT